MRACVCICDIARVHMWTCLCAMLLPFRVLPTDERHSAIAKASVSEDPSVPPTPYGAQIHSFKNIRGRWRVACGAACVSRELWWRVREEAKEC